MSNDAFGLTRNPSTKIDIFYFTLLNLEYWMQSSRDDIYTCLVCKTSVLRQIGYQTLVDPLIKDIEKINQQRIPLSDGYEAKIILHSIAADNDASNDMMDIEKFRSKFCKKCDISYTQLQEIYSNNYDFKENPILCKKVPSTHAFNSLDKSLIFNLGI